MRSKLSLSTHSYCPVTEAKPRRGWDRAGQGQTEPSTGLRFPGLFSPSQNQLVYIFKFFFFSLSINECFLKKQLPIVQLSENAP